MTANVGNFEVVTALLCEQVRQEINNKFTIVGTFSGDVHVASFPAVFLASIYLQLYAKDAGQFSVELQITSPGKDQPNQLMIALGAEITAPGPTVVPMPQFPIQSEGPGEITIELRQNGGAWNKIIERRIDLGVFS